MSYKNIVYVKLEKRLLNDHRWYMMSDHAQLLYIKLILLAAETYNKIPKLIPTLITALRSELEFGKFKCALEEVKKNFPKLKANKHFYYFEEFEYKTNFIPKQEILRKSPGVPKYHAEEEEEKKKKKKNSIPPTIEEIIDYCKERNNKVDPNKFINHYQAKGWLIGKNKMKDWKAAVRTWEQTEDRPVHKPGKTPARIRVMALRAAKISDPDIKQELITDGYSEVDIDGALGRT